MTTQPMRRQSHGHAGASVSGASAGQSDRQPRTVAWARPGTLAWIGQLSDVWFAILAAALSATLGLYQLAQPSLWIDESFTARAVSRSYGHLIHEHHMAYYGFMKVWASFAGTSEFALRLPSVIAAAAACALVVPLGNRLLGRPVGSVAGVVLALNSFVVQWSQQARSYAFVLLLALVATIALVRLVGTQTRWSWAGYTLSLGALLLLQPLSAGLLAAAHVVAARGARLRVVGACVTVTLLASPFLIGVYRRDSEAGTLVWNDRISAGRTLLALLEISGAVGVGLLLSVVALVVAPRERLLLASWAFGPLLICAALTPFEHALVDRYLLVSAPAFALLIAAALSALRGPWRLGAAGALAAGVVASLMIWYSPTGSDNWAGQDWKAATRYAMQQGGATVEPSLAVPAFTYYGGVVRNTGLVLVLGQAPADTHDASVVGQFGYLLTARKKP
jgi:mannosyltransferase